MRLILTESLIILGLLLLNGVFAMSEIAVVTSRRARLKQRADEGSAGARQAMLLVDEPTRFLSTVQIGITLIGVLAGAFGGATIAEELDARLELIPALAPFSEALALFVVVAAVSFCSLVIGELVPKRIAMQSPERIASIVAIPMQGLARIASPLVTVLTFTTRAILRLLRVPETKGTRVTEEEIRAVIAEGRQSGAVHLAEQEMLEGVFRLGDRSVRDLMIARPDVDWVDVDDEIVVVRERFTRPSAESVLVCRGSLDEVVGVVQPARLLADLLRGEPLALTTQAATPLFVPGSMAVLRLLEMFKQSRQRFAVVLDEYGGVEGVIALDEVLEEVVGEVPEASDIPETTIVARADGTFLVDGSSEMAEVVERFSLGQLPDVDRGTYRTLAGFVMARLGHLPRATDAFVYRGVRFEVIDMDERRVDKVLVTPAPIQPS
jgi:putative hemolysin